MQTYVKIPNSIFSLKISPAAFKVFVYLSSRNIAKNGVCVKYEAIANKLHLSISTVTRAVSELNDARLIHKRHRLGSKGYKANLYYVKSAPVSSYFTIDNEIITGKMPHYTFMVYCYIISRMDNRSNQAFPSLSTIATDTGLSKSTVISSIKYLRNYSYLNKINRRNYRKNRTTRAFRQNRYKFFNYVLKASESNKIHRYNHIVFTHKAINTIKLIFSKIRWCIFDKTLTKPTKDKLTERKNI